MIPLPRARQARIGISAALFAAIAGCIRDVDTSVPASAQRGARTMIMIVSTKSSSPTTLNAFAVALDPDGRGRDPPPLSLAPMDEVFVLFFPCPLEAFGLREGPLSVPDPQATRPLPPTPNMTHYSLDGGWQPIAALPAPIKDLKLVHEPQKCPSFVIGARQSLAPAGPPPRPLVVPIDGDSALVGATGGPFFRISKDAFVRLSLDPSTPSLAGYRAPSGELWLFGEDGRLVHGRLESGFVEAARTTPTSTSAIAGPRDGSQFELFLATSRPSFERFSPDEGRWSEIATFMRPFSPSRILDVTWVGSREAVAAIPANPAIQWYQDGGSVARPLLDRAYPWAVAVHSTLGVVVGTNQGRVQSFQAASAAPVGLPHDFGAAVSAMGAFGDSVLIGNVDGGLVDLLADGSTCPVAELGPFIVRKIVSLRSGVVVAFGGSIDARGVGSRTDLFVVHIERRTSCLADLYPPVN